MDETKKKRKSQPVIFPPIFTVEELNESHPDIVQITLRYKITTAIDRGIIAELGTIPRAVGRPHKVYGREPLSKDTFHAAKAKSVKFNEKIDKRFKDLFEALTVADKSV